MGVKYMHEGVTLTSSKGKVDLKLHEIPVEIYFPLFIKEERKTNNLDCFVLKDPNHRHFNVIILVLCVEPCRLQELTSQRRESIPS